MTTIQRLLPLLLALLALACEASPVEVYAAPGLEGHTFVAIEAWNEALSEHCPDHPGLALVAEREGSEVTVAWGMHPDIPEAAGVTFRTQIVVTEIAKKYGDGFIEHTIAHELGHALGATHDEGRGVMGAAADTDVDTAHVSREDAWQVCNKYLNPTR